MDECQAYRLILTARRVEERLVRSYADGQLTGWIHSCDGQEALAPAVRATIEPEDSLVPHYRSRPEQIGKGMSVRQVLAEVYARSSATSGGRGGETHVYSPDHRIFGMTGVLGANIPIATGAALADQLLGRGAVTFCTFGDGTASRGAFHEALNMAAIWHLPVVFVCIDNHFSEMSVSADFRSVPRVSDRASSYGIPSAHVDGAGWRAVADALAEARAHAISTGPFLLDVDVVRRRGHWEGDPQTYRSRDDSDEIATRDPVAQQLGILRAEGVDDTTIASIEAEVNQVVDEAFTWVLKEPGPTEQTVTSGVYAVEHFA